MRAVSFWSSELCSGLVPLIHVVFCFDRNISCFMEVVECSSFYDDRTDV